MSKSKEFYKYFLKRFNKLTEIYVSNKVEIKTITNPITTNIKNLNISNFKLLSFLRIFLIKFMPETSTINNELIYIIL